MSSLSPVGRSAAARKVDRFAVTPKNDRVSLCSSTLHLLPPSVMLSAAKHLTPSPAPNLPNRQRHPLSPLALSKVQGTTLRSHARLLDQTETPLGSTGATSATSAPTAISFRINTYKPPRNC